MNAHTHVVEFDTQAEAIAFERGIEMMRGPLANCMIESVVPVVGDQRHFGMKIVSLSDD